MLGVTIRLGVAALLAVAAGCGTPDGPAGDASPPTSVADGPVLVAEDAGCTAVSPTMDVFVGRTADSERFVGLVSDERGIRTLWSHSAGDGECRGIGSDGADGAWMLTEAADRPVLRHLGPGVVRDVVLMSTDGTELPREAHVGASGDAVFLLERRGAVVDVWKVDAGSGDATKIDSHDVGEDAGDSFELLLGGNGEAAVFFTDPEGSSLVDVSTGETYVRLDGEVFIAWGGTDVFIAAVGPVGVGVEEYLHVDGGTQRTIEEPCPTKGSQLRGLLPSGELLCYRDAPGYGALGGVLHVEMLG